MPRDDHAADAVPFPDALAAPAGGLDADDFKAVFRNHAAGVTIITAEGPNGPAALTATSVSSLSATPPLLLFTLTSASSTAPAIIDADTVVIHFLNESHAALAKLSATSGVDRFDGPAWTRLATGEPLFLGVDTWIRGEVVNRMQVGTSTVVAVHALEAAYPEDPAATRPLVYHNRVWHALGEGSRLDVGARTEDLPPTQTPR